MVDLYSADAHEDPQNFWVLRFENQRWIQTRPALLDKGEVEAGSICDCLHASRVAGKTRAGRLGGSAGNDGVGRSVTVTDRNCWLVLDVEWSLKMGTEIRIFGTAITCVPPKINIEFQEIRQSSDVPGSSRLAAR